MRTATVTIKSLSPYSQSMAFRSEKSREQTHDDFDQAAWREHIHADVKGNVFIPAVAFMKGLAEAASYLGKGGELKKKGSATWAQNFQCGMAIAAGPPIGKTVDDAVGERVYCHADGNRKSGKRVWRTFPLFDNWSAKVTIHILDDTIPEEIFRRVFEAFGLFIGVGRYRPENGGYLGRFTVEDIEIK